MHSRKNDQHSTDFDINKSLELVRSWLPAQSPIKDFVHHNTLHAFEGKPFEEAVLEAASLLGANPYLPIGEYRKYFDLGKIKKEFLISEARLILPENILSRSFFGGAFTGEHFLQTALSEYTEYSDIQAIQVGQGHPEIAHAKLSKVENLCRMASILDAFSFNVPFPKRDAPRSQLVLESGIDLDHKVNSILFRLIGSYLDQGASLWKFPHVESGFYEGILKVSGRSFLPLAPFVVKSELYEFEEIGSQIAAGRLLDVLCPDPLRKEDYIRETLLAHPGWSGIVAVLEADPKQLRDPRPITLMDFLAVKLLLEVQALRHCKRRKKVDVPCNRTYDPGPCRDKGRSAALAAILLKYEINYDQIHDLSAIETLFLKQLLTWISHDSLTAIWHRALERTTYQSVLAGVRANAELRSKEVKSTEIKDITAVFCLDDREASIRRYLEEDETIATEATAGFFGLDFLFKSINDSHPVKLCPVPVKPRHLVIEKSVTSSTQHAQKKILTFSRILRDELSHSIVLGGVLSLFSFPWIFLKILIRTFRPSFFAQFSRYSPVGLESELEFIRPAEEISEIGLIQGYSIQEMADRVAGELISTGIVERLSPLIVLVAHGSSSVNNPHYAAYDCGACSGRPGAANAKTFARMANHLEVRKQLRLRGIIIPKTSVFVGAFHDTSRDTLTFFDERFIDESHQKLITHFKKTSLSALMRNSKERVRRFETVPLNLEPAAAHREVLYRSVALFEPRPEMNHATNAYCIVGRRSLTQGLFLDRRAFLQSYDAGLDLSGNILMKILSAVVPVCAGINLEYLFSKIDNEVYGSGTKLPHNVASLLGVMNGVDGDLRTGLPKQMIEIHEPVRMIFIVERNAAELSSILKEMPTVANWFENRWAFLVSIDPIDRCLKTFISGKGFEADLSEPVELPTITRMDDYVAKTHENLQIALILSNAGISPSEVKKHVTH